MTGPIGLAISRPVGVIVCLLLVMVFGVVSLRAIPVQLTPDIEIPSLTVQTNWPGAAPVEIEREILVPQEEVLKSVQGLVKMTSDATPERGNITLEMEVGTDLDEALVRVSNRLTQVPRYPETADQPVVSTAGDTGPPLAVVLLRAKDGSPVGQYKTWFEDDVLPDLERIRGVSKIDVNGGQDTDVQVVIDLAGLAARNIPITGVINKIRAELLDVSGGDVTLGKRQYRVRTAAAPEELPDLQALVIGYGDQGQPVRLGDVARVDLGLRKKSSVVLGDNREALALLFRREVGSNVLSVTEEILATVAKIQAETLDPMGLELRVVSDQSGYIRDALALVRDNIIVGGILAGLVLVFFLRNLRAALLVAASIPVCTLGTALAMVLFGRSVNVVSLAGMAFASGMVVDASIVITESVDLWRSRVRTIEEAAYEGSREVWGALVASTLTTVVVFVPILSWQDQSGQLLRDLSLAVSVAVLLSLLYSVLVIPSLVVRFGVKASAEPERQPVADAIGRFARYCSESVPRSLTISLASVAITSMLTFWLVPPMEYLPTGNRNFLFGQLVPPPGYSIDEMLDIGQRFQDSLQPHVGAEVGGVPGIERSFFVARPGSAFMGASALDPDRIKDLVGLYRRKQAELPGVIGVAAQSSLFGRGVTASRSVDVQISGADLASMVRLGGALMPMLKEAMPGAQIRPIPSLDLGAPELRIAPRREEAAQNGLSGADIGTVVDVVVDGRIIGELGRDGHPNLKVMLLGAEDARDPTAVRAAPLATPVGRVIPLSAVAAVDETMGPSTIQHIERKRAITLQVSPPEDLALEEAMRRVTEDVLPKVDVPAGISIDLAGNADDLSQAQGQLASTLAFAVLICWLLMAALFEDFVGPLVILVTMPMAGAGGLAALALIDKLAGPQPLDMMTAVGFVILVGTVVNNAILIVDGALLRLREGAPLHTALEQAVARRVRPILMTTLTTLAGLLPLVFFPGSGSELYRGVGAVVLGGLSLSTVLALFVVPAVFALTWRALGRA